MAKKKAKPRKRTKRAVKIPVWKPAALVRTAAAEPNRPAPKPASTQAQQIISVLDNVGEGLSQLASRLYGLAGRCGVPQPPESNASGEARSSRPGVMGDLHERADEMQNRVAGLHAIVSAIEEQI